MARPARKEEVMLPTCAIPMYDDDTSDWHTFLYKAAKGSIKACDTLHYAKMAYMVALTGDPESPDHMSLDDYNNLVRIRFPTSCPIESIQQFHDSALSHGWLKTSFRVSTKPINAPSEYRAIWGRKSVRESELMNDAMLNCLASWSPDHYISCTGHYGAEYDSRVVTSGMLYLSLTWPGT